MGPFVFPLQFSPSPLSSTERYVRRSNLLKAGGMPDGQWRMGVENCRVPYILQKEAPRMESRKTGAALDERFTWPNTAHPIPSLNYTENLLSPPRARGSRLPHLVVILAKHLYVLAAYRRTMPVREYIYYPNLFGTKSEYFLCPRCDITMDREYQSYCDRCGQRLGWRSIDKAKERRRTF